MDSGHDLAPGLSPVKSGRAGRRSTWFFSLIWLLIAGTLIAIGDHLLRRQENLVATIANAPVMIPFSDFLQDRIHRKTDWLGLLETRRQALVAGNAGKFADATYNANTFAQEIDALDGQRRNLLIDLVNRYPDSSDVAHAYFLLLDPKWNAQLASQHAQYTQKLLDLSVKEADGGAAMQLALAQVLQSNKEQALELKVLRVIAATQPMSMAVAPAMRRLLEIIGPSDPDRPKVSQSLASFQIWHDRMLEEAKTYQAIQTAQVTGDLDEMLRLRAGMPADVTDSFIAGADCSLIAVDLLNGRFEDALRRREAVAHFDPKDISDCATIAMEFEPPMTETAKPKKKSSSVPQFGNAVPDRTEILFNRWRGLLDLGDQTAASAIAASLFTGGDKKLAKPAGDLAKAMRGDFKGVGLVAKCRLRTDEWPPEMQGARDVSYVAMDLKPVTPNTSPAIHARLEMWISRDLILQVVTTDEPRSPRPKPVVSRHDDDPWREEYFEFFMNPDCWFNFYYQWAVTSAGVTWDARRNLTSSPAKMQFSTDKKLDLGLRSTSWQTDTGWTVRLLMPRKLLIPPGPAIVRFNVRRKRHVMAGKADLQQFYGWAPIPNSDHQPDKFGWLFVPN